jgi:hypothetical protein
MQKQTETVEPLMQKFYSFSGLWITPKTAQFPVTLQRSDLSKGSTFTE